jgi:hypothetical protein
MKKVQITRNNKVDNNDRITSKYNTKKPNKVEIEEWNQKDINTHQ